MSSAFETNLSLNATKSYAQNNGLVCINDWKKYATGRPILFTVKDEGSQRSWTRIVDPKSTTTKATVRMQIPTSSVHQSILVYAEPLEEKRDVVFEQSIRQFAVQSTICCVATATPSSEQEILSYLMNRLSVGDFNDDLPLELEQRSVDRISLSMARSRRSVRQWLITVAQVDDPHQTFVFLVPTMSDITVFDVPVIFKAGCNYSIETKGLDLMGGNMICQSSTTFKAALTLREIRLLHQKAIEHVGSRSALCRVFYRNKKPKYFDHILRKRGGIMEAYIKDNSGDPGSPINDHLNGLFFMASVKPGSKTGEPITVSAFGAMRVLVPAEELLAKASNLYFVDFFCMRGKNHYVTLVMTNPGSEADQFCSTHLLPLDISKKRKTNPFLFYNEFGGLQVSAKKDLIVELFFTENLDIRGYTRLTTSIVGKGHSTIGGIPKNPECPKCNLKTEIVVGKPSPFSFATE